MSEHVLVQQLVHTRSWNEHVAMELKGWVIQLGRLGCVKPWLPEEGLSTVMARGEGQAHKKMGIRNLQWGGLGQRFKEAKQGIRGQDKALVQRHILHSGGLDAQRPFVQGLHEVGCNRQDPHCLQGC